MAEDVQGMLAALCGANADYVGGALDSMPERRRENIGRICRIALRRLGTGIAEPGAVHPRVIGCLLGDGSFVTDAVAAEYWGGVLACARVADGKEDRAARKMKTLARLGVNDIRTHYHFFTALRLLLRHRHGKGMNVGAINFDDKDARFRLATFIPAGFYILAMDYNRDEIERMPRIVSDVLVSLGMEFLVDGSNTGSDEYLKKFFPPKAIHAEGMVFTPGIQGIQLLLWAFGRRDRPHAFFLDDAFDCRIEGVQMGVDEAGLVF